MSHSEATATAPAKSPRSLMLGGLLIAVGGFIVSISQGWIPSPPESFGAPRDIVLCAGLIFALPGFLFLGGEHAPKWFGALVGALIWTMFATIPSWIAWASGPRSFDGDGLWILSLLGFDVSTVGRFVFGLVALLMWLCAALAWRAWLQSLALWPRIAAGLCLAIAAGWLLWGRYQEPQALPGESEQDRLARYIEHKHADLDYEASNSNPFLQTRAEPWIKRARARLAATRTAPPRTDMHAIPAVATAPVVDGRIESGEWSGALVVPLAPHSRHARVLIAAHAGKLYLAAEAPQDNTNGGFDQFRFYYHMDLAPAFEHERIHVGRNSAEALRAVRRAGRKFSGSEWNVLSQLKGDSVIAGHRQFELELDLAEAGLPTGVPFPVYLEIEGDPIKDKARKFKSRFIEGKSGDYQNPVWMQIGK